MKQGSNIKIVQFSSEHRDQVIKLIDTLLKDLRVIPNIEEMIDDADLFNISEIYSGNSKFWVALDGEKVVGTIAIKMIDENNASLKRMFVIKNLHGTGLGQLLINKAIKFASEQGYSKILLNTHPLMYRAHRFYEKNGFTKVSEDHDRYHFEKFL